MIEVNFKNIYGRDIIIKSLAQLSKDIRTKYKVMPVSTKGDVKQVAAAPDFNISKGKITPAEARKTMARVRTYILKLLHQEKAKRVSHLLYSISHEPRRLKISLVIWALYKN